MIQDDPNPEYLIVVLRVRILPHEVPWWVRVKRCIKHLLRGYGLECLEIRTEKDEKKPA